MWIFLFSVISVLTASVRCQSCPSGYYSHNGVCSPCQENCEECTWSNKCKRCKTGHYLLGISCYPCPPDCESCSLLTRSICGSCKAVGYYGTECTKRCSNGCKHRVCNKFDGHCRHGCLNGYYGNKCSRCPDVCTTCSSSTSCTMCRVGHYGSMCDQRCRNCRKNICSIKGFCTHGCLEGFYPDATGCTACPDNCSKCRSNTVCDECSPRYYGHTCHLPCLDICRTCTLDRDCLECTGRNEQQCDHNCSKTCFGSCSREYGECFGCVRGYYKGTGRCLPCTKGCARCLDIDVCTECLDGYSLVPGTNTCHDGETQHGSEVILHFIVPGAGLLVVVVLVGCIACLAVRYRKRRNGRDPTTQEALYITVQSDSTPNNTYATVHSAGDLMDTPIGPSQPETAMPMLRNPDVSAPGQDREPSKIHAPIDETTTEVGTPSGRSKHPRTLRLKPPATLQRRGTPTLMNTLVNQDESLRGNGASKNVYSSLGKTITSTNSSEHSDRQETSADGALSEEGPACSLPAGEYESLRLRQTTDDTYASIPTSATTRIPLLNL